MSEETAPKQTPADNSSVKFVKPEEMSDRMADLRETIARRAFEIFETDRGLSGHGLEHCFQAESELLHPVRVEICDAGDTVTLRAEVPGFQASELQVSLEATRVTISGKKHAATENKAEKTIYSERCSRQLFRSIALPIEIDTASATATLGDGILSLGLRKGGKAKPAPPTKVDIKAA